MTTPKFLSATRYIQELPHKSKFLSYCELLILCSALTARCKFDSILRVCKHFNLSKLNEIGLEESQCDVPIELLVVSSRKDLAILPLAVNSIFKNCLNPIDSVTLIVQRSAMSLAAKIMEEIPDTKVPIRILDEETLVTQEFRNHLKRRYKNRYGWVLQQVLKVNYALSSSQKGLLILDADTIVLKKVGFLQKNGRQALLISSSLHKEYFHKLKLLGFSPVKPWISTVAHYMLFQPHILRFAMNSIHLNSAQELIEKLEAVDLSIAENQSPFSIDYELYGQWMISNEREKLSLHLTQNIELKRDEKSLKLVSELISADSSTLKYTSASLHSYL